MSRLLRANTVLLGQVIRLLESLPASLYRRTADDQSAIGAHVRHICDFYLALTSDQSSGEVDYDARQREARIESDSGFAIETMRRLILVLENMSASTDRQLKVTSAVDSVSDACSVQSTLSRELSFLHSHTTHHMAIVAMLSRQHGFAVADELGVAPSTLQHRNISSR